MSVKEPGAVNQDPYVQNAHATNGLGKKVKFVDEINFGYENDIADYPNANPGSSRDHKTDLLRLDSKRNWSEDTISDAVSFSLHSEGQIQSSFLKYARGPYQPGQRSTIIDVAGMTYMPTGITPYIKHIECARHMLHPVGLTGWRPSNSAVEFGDSVEWYQRAGTTNESEEVVGSQAIVIRGKYYAGTPANWHTNFQAISQDNTIPFEERKRLTTIYFRNNILNAKHAKYVMYGYKATGNSADDTGTGKGGMFGPPENFTIDQIIDHALNVFEETFGEIEPVFSPDRLHTDHYFNLDTLFDRDERDELQNLPSGLIFDADPTYNFYETTYENTITSGVNEALIPNMYMILHGSYKDYPDPGVETLITLGASAVNESNFINSSGEKSDTAIAAEEYFKRFGDNFAGSGQAYSDPGGISYIKEAVRGKHLGFLAKDISILKDYNDKVNKFPMAATIRFTSQTNLILPAMLEDTNLDYLFAKHTMMANELRSESGQLGAQYKQVDFRKFGQYMDKNTEDGSPQLKSYVVPRVAQMAHFGTLLKMFTHTGGDTMEQMFEYNKPHPHHRFVGDIPAVFKQASDSDNKGLFFRQLMGVVTKSKMTSLAAQKMRSYSDILKGKPAYHEIIMYRVAKHVVNDGNINPSPIQNIYFCNSNNISEFIYNDTQVIYGKEYKYVVYAYVVVFGTEYAVCPITRPSNDFSVVFADGTEGPYSNTYESEFAIAGHVLTRPSVQVVEVPYYGLEFDEPSSAFIFDDPPMPPNIDIGGYRGINNKILISLSNNFGSMITEPIVLEDGDNDIFNNVKSYQSLSKKLVAENKIRFESDDPSAAFQIFRIGPDPVTGRTSHPVSYGDFKGKRIKTISYPDADSASFVDRLQPNKKYFYVFRTIDVHGNISNPTIPYEVEMVSEPGSKLAYVIVREAKFFEPIKPTFKKGLKRFLHIDPREQHKYTKINSLEDIDAEAFAINPPPLGVVKDPLFVKKTHAGKERPRRFKLRLTSKKSGKKVDINIKFVHDHDKLKKA